MFGRAKSVNSKSTNSKSAKPKTVKPVKKQAGANRRASKDVFVPVGTWRYQVVGVIFLSVFGALIARAAYLQIVDTEYLQSQGDARYLRCLLYTSPSPRDS